jgi:hypothetical protein
MALRSFNSRLEILEHRDHSLADWQSLPFNAGWSDFGGLEEAAGFWRSSSGIVFLRGEVKSTGTIPDDIGTLPVGFRPSTKKRFAVVSNNAFGAVSILTTGVINVDVGSVVRVSLSGISFRAEL